VFGKQDGDEYHIAHARSLHILHGTQFAAFLLALMAATTSDREPILQTNRGDRYYATRRTK
jgi:hypothetical protein